MDRLFRYIPISLADAAMRAGWSPTPALCGTPHGAYSVLCEWLCDCEPAWPLTGSASRENSEAAE